MSEYIYASSGEPLANFNGEISLARKKIVRCKDCAKFVPQGTFCFNSDVTIKTNRDACEVVRGYIVQINPNGFCAWGERRENE